MANRLAQETSPYLLQHAHNPVDWYPWGREALERARREDRPILLSIGYSACHWCHVMERESFEDEDVAAFMNANFVNIKVDREERPDLDDIYMNAVQAFTGGHGGWPMTVFLTPAGEPFLGGTYFPPEPRHGLPSFSQLMMRAAQVYRSPDRERVTTHVLERLERMGTLPGGAAEADDWLDAFADACDEAFDPRDAGFGGAPKFPPHQALVALLAHWRRTGRKRSLDMVTRTLDAMARGGMYDLAGGGFARYSVDGAWRIPHFEKMLYDNGQLVPVYLDAWRATGRPHYRRIAVETLDFVLREMRLAHGGFAAAFDADSEGEEGLFYTWTPGELRAALGMVDGLRVAALLQVTDAGTFEHGRSVLRLEQPLEDLDAEDRGLLERVLPRLLEVRGERVPPGRDDKVVTAWNALMIAAFARGAAALDEPRYAEAAATAARLLLDVVTVDGRLHRTYKDERVGPPAFLDDHAFLTAALIDLYEATADESWLGEALVLADRTVELFADDADGGLFFTGSDAEELVTRAKKMVGGAEPSGMAVAALSFARLATLCGREDLGARADGITRALQSVHDRAPRAVPLESVVVAWRQGPAREVALVGDADGRLWQEVRARYLPFTVTARFDEPPAALLPWTEGKHAEGGATAYVCEGFTCQAPTRDPAELAEQLEAASRPVRAAALGGPRVHAPALPASPEAWIGAAPHTLQELRGHVVVLDFWTYCCINCMHVLPELAAVEARFEGQPVVVLGVHSAKFPAERERDRVELAMSRHGVTHPVVLDPDHDLWQQYAVRSWPTVVVLDTTGRVAWQRAGEVSRDVLVDVVERLLAESEPASTPLQMVRELDRTGALAFPGKVHVHDTSLFVADTGHHRIIEAELGWQGGWPTARLVRVLGEGKGGLSDGLPGRMREPQGMRVDGEVLWVADTGNHALRRIDLATGSIETVAGTGALGRGGRADPGHPRSTDLRSPWDVEVTEDAIVIAMAGSHQLWVYMKSEDRVGPFVGSGAEAHVDGPPGEAALAQPSGLALHGPLLFWVDSETSSVRMLDLRSGHVSTVVGRGLFDFGDVDGAAEDVRLQHPLGIVADVPHVWVADTFNGKIKHLSLADGQTRTLAAGLGEPGGLARFGDFLLVADTNHHRVAAVRLADGKIRDLQIEGLAV